VQLKPKKPGVLAGVRNEEDGKLKIDQITGKSGPVQRRTRAPRASRREEPQLGGEAEGSGGAAEGNPTIDGNAEHDAQGEEQAAGEDRPTAEDALNAS
jgi:hypothetical protein